MRIVFMGTPEFAVPILAALLAAGHEIAAVYTQPDRPAGRKKRLTPPPVKDFALGQGLTVYQPASLRSAEEVERLRALAPEVICVAAFGQILRRTVLEIPPLGCLNVHASLLPKLRGASPIAAAIANGEDRTGVTIMLMDQGMDTGPILAQEEIAILPEDTAETLGARLAEVGARLLVETLPRWARGEIQPRPQDDAQATYCRPLTKEDGRIDWSLPAEVLWRQVRAYQPWPGSYTYWQGRMLKVLQASVVADRPVGVSPGQVYLAERRQLAVGAGQGALLVQRLQPEGRRPMTGAEFLAGHPEIVGAVIG